MKNESDPDVGPPRASRRDFLGLVSVPLGSLVLGACGGGDAPPPVGLAPAPAPSPGPVPSPPPPPPPPGGIDALSLNLEPATPEQIGLYLPVTRALAGASRLMLRYKAASDTTWRDGHPLLRIHPEWCESSAPVTPVDGFAGSIFDLAPATTYDIELTLVEPGRSNQTLTARTTTRALPAPAPAATKTATSSDNLQAKLDALVAGDVLELASGVYDVNGLVLARSGTAASPIYIRGASRSGVTLRDTGGAVLQIQAASFVVIENITLVGSGVDSGTAASSVGISFWSGAQQDSITLRDLDINGIDMGIVASGVTRSLLVYNNALRGNNVWTQPFIETNLTWNDDGIRVPGLGNAVFENTLHGFGDSFAVIDGVQSTAVYFYRNRVTMTGDDAFEGDYATRNIGFYDNHISNCATFLSLDPLWGGPLYCFRNVVINTTRGPFKFNNTNTGFMVYNNTVVRTEGLTGWGWIQNNDGALHQWSYRNNLLIYRGGGDLLAVNSSANDPIDVTHNAWYPDRAVWWSNSGGSFSSPAAARTGLPATTPVFGTSNARHTGDVIAPSDPFVTAITLGPSHLTEITTSFTPLLRSGTSPKGAGTPIANVTDGHSGPSPDIGALIEGRAVPRWGAQR